MSLPAISQGFFKRFSRYPLRLHRALLDYSLGNNPKAFRQTLNDVEVLIATTICDEGGSLLHHF